MIRQTITCDTCGIERKQANHWFEAFEHEGELRIRGLVPSKNTRPGMKHLCGQTCLHRLVDDFLAGNLTSRMTNAAEEPRSSNGFGGEAVPRKVESAPFRSFDLDEFESSARLIQAAAGASPRHVPTPPPASPPVRQAAQKANRPGSGFESGKSKSIHTAFRKTSLPKTPVPAMAKTTRAKAAKLSPAKPEPVRAAKRQGPSGSLAAAHLKSSLLAPSPDFANAASHKEAELAAIQRPAAGPLNPQALLPQAAPAGPLNLVSAGRAIQNAPTSIPPPASRPNATFAESETTLTMSSSSAPARSRHAAAWEREKDRERMAALRQPDAKRQKFL